MTPEKLHTLRQRYRTELLENTIPFWLRHGLDREHGGLLSALGRRGEVVDTDKPIWVQGRAAWTFATLYNVVEPRPEWLAASECCLRFLQKHGARLADGKLYFTVTREGAPLRMRRYHFSECFAAIGAAAFAKASGEVRAKDNAIGFFSRFLRSIQPGAPAQPKVEPTTRPMRGLGAQIMIIATAQELRANLDDVAIGEGGETCTEWIDRAVAEIERDFYKPEKCALLEVVGEHGELLDHFEGRLLNPGHGIECAWFLLHEAACRLGKIGEGKRSGAVPFVPPTLPRSARYTPAQLIQLGLGILDCMWERGWDTEFGGLFGFTDLEGKPTQEVAAQMKFWWPQNEAEIATLLAWKLTGEAKYAQWHELVHTWSRRIFADPEFGEWFGYAQRDGRISTQLKGGLWKGPFHIPRMQLYCWKLLESA